MAKQLQMIKEFNLSFGNEVHDEPNVKFMDNAIVTSKCIGLIAEEINEYYDSQNDVDRLDALCDIWYVAGGMLCYIGSYDEESSKYVDVNNMQVYIPMLNETVISGSYEDCKNILFSIIRKVRELGQKYDRFEEAFEYVHNNNMSKMCETELDAKLTCERYKGNKLHKEVSYKKTPTNLYAVYNSDESSEMCGKILKSYKWVEPDLSQFL